jgi:hypothetical protein
MTESLSHFGFWIADPSAWHRTGFEFSEKDRKKSVHRLVFSGFNRKSKIENPKCYLITLSAHASTFGGIVRPRCFAVFRLMVSSNFRRLLHWQITCLGSLQDLFT